MLEATHNRVTRTYRSGATNPLLHGTVFCYLPFESFDFPSASPGITLPPNLLQVSHQNIRLGVDELRENVRLKVKKDTRPSQVVMNPKVKTIVIICSRERGNCNDSKKLEQGKSSMAFSERPAKVYTCIFWSQG